MRISDRSSDVCSSDLLTQSLEYWRHVLGDNLPAPLDIPADRPRGRSRSYRGATAHRALNTGLFSAMRGTIGRASCRDKVCHYVLITVIATTIKKNKRTV